MAGMVPHHPRAVAFFLEKKTADCLREEKQHNASDTCRRVVVPGVWLSGVSLSGGSV